MYEDEIVPFASVSVVLAVEHFNPISPCFFECLQLHLWDCRVRWRTLTLTLHCSYVASVAVWQ